jgi:putative membrane protein
LYPAYVGRTTAWGLTTIEDQQLGGLIMWIPAGLVYIAAGLALFAGWLVHRKYERDRSHSSRFNENCSLLRFCNALIACRDKAAKWSRALAGGYPARGKTALSADGCVAPGVSGPSVLIAPPLIGISQRSYLPGMLENTP